MQFPEYRPRRMRRSEGLRRMIRETRLSVDNLVYPLFICPGREVRRPISTMPGQSQVSVDQAVIEAKECLDLGIPAVILFGVPDDAKNPLDVTKVIGSAATPGTTTDWCSRPVVPSSGPVPSWW